jgi:hypothetical protein
MAHGVRSLSDEELDLLWEKLSRNLWAGVRVKTALMRCGALLERCSDEEVETNLRVARLMKEQW